MLIVTEDAARRLVSMAQAIAVMEKAFAALEHGDAEVFPVARGRGPLPGTLFAIKSGIISSQGLVGLKVGTYWPHNREIGVESHGSTTFFLDSETGFPRAMVAAAHLTALRTAGVDGLAVSYLSRKDASVVGIVGASHQAWFELMAVAEARPLRRVLVWNRTEHTAHRFAARAGTELDLDAEVLDLPEVAAGSDIIVTATASETPLLRAEWVRPGTHISAMGADMPGKQELDVALVARSTLFADVVDQSVTLGEFEAAARSGCIESSNISTLGSVVTGSTKGRTSDNEITIFDSSGTAIQDLAIGVYALERALAAGEAKSVNLVR